MRTILSTGLLILMLLQLSFKPVVVLGWKINQDIITEKYCVNKDRPMLHCNGQCYLAKQLRQLRLEEQKERSRHSLPVEIFRSETAFLIVGPVFDGFSQGAEIDFGKVHFLNPSEKRAAGFVQACFHPPEQLVA